MDIIKCQTQKAVAHAARAPQLFGFGLFITTSTYLYQKSSIDFNRDDDQIRVDESEELMNVV